MAEEDNKIDSKETESTSINENEVTAKEAEPEPTKPHTEEDNSTLSTAEPSKPLIKSKIDNAISAGDNKEGEQTIDPEEDMKKKQRKHPQKPCYV